MFSAVKKRVFMIDFKSKVHGFTLAEVLIVLAIIGVVAALCIPALINKVQKQEYVTALKKFYSTQQDGWSRLLADEGVDKLEDTSVFQSMNGDSCLIDDANGAACEPFFKALKKYFKFDIVTAPSCQTYYLDGEEDPHAYYTGKTVLAFADGSVMFEADFYKPAISDESINAQIAASGGHMYSYQGWFDIDINGFKKPNTMGRDMFSFYISGDGKLYPDGGKDSSLGSGGNLYYTWQGEEYSPHWCGTPGSTDVSHSSGTGCTARIMEEGWQMN